MLELTAEISCNYSVQNSTEGLQEKLSLVERCAGCALRFVETPRFEI